MLIFLDDKDGTAQDVLEALISYDEEYSAPLGQSDRLKKVIKSIKEQL